MNSRLVVMAGNSISQITVVVLTVFSSKEAMDDVFVRFCILKCQIVYLPLLSETEKLNLSCQIF